MASTSVKNLDFIVSLIDQMSGPAQNITKSFTQMQSYANKGFNNMTKGVLATAGAGYTLVKAIQPGIEMTRALGEIKSLGVVDKELKLLEKTADKFALAYGESATDFVRSSYDIQSAIGGLVDGELASFTNASNILAKATKADAATITNYMGTMYNIFDKQAIAMGKSKWVETLTGMTSEAVRVFKTTGQGMSDAFKNLGSLGEKNKIFLSEQMAVLGTLQGSMGGSEAGTKYKAFLNNVVKAQQTLGLSFVDSKGKMLPMVQILEKIKGKYGELDAIEISKLKTAFGSDEAVAVVTNLIGKTNELSGSITSLDKVSGMKNAEQMAKAQTDLFARFGAAVEVLQKNFAKLIITGITPFLEKCVEIGAYMNSFFEKYPTISKWLAMITVGIIAMTAAMGVLYIITGMVNTAMATYKGILVLARVAQLLLNFSIYQCPLIWIIAGIAALAVGVIYLIKQLYGFENIGQVFDSWIGGIEYLWELLKGFGSFVMSGIEVMVSGFATVVGWIGKGIELLTNFSPIIEALSKLATSVFGGVGMSVEWVFNKISDLADTIANLPGVSWILDKLFGGEEEASGSAAAGMAGSASKGTGGVSDLNEQRKIDIPAGGITNNLGSSRTTNYGNVNIYSSGGMSPAQMEEWNALHS